MSVARFMNGNFSSARDKLEKMDFLRYHSIGGRRALFMSAFATFALFVWWLPFVWRARIQNGANLVALCSRFVCVQIINSSHLFDMFKPQRRTREDIFICVMMMINICVIRRPTKTIKLHNRVHTLIEFESCAMCNLYSHARRRRPIIIVLVLNLISSREIVVFLSSRVLLLLVLHHITNNNSE